MVRRRVSRACRRGHIVLPGVDVGPQQRTAGIGIGRSCRGRRMVRVVVVQVVREGGERRRAAARNGVLVVADEETGGKVSLRKWNEIWKKREFLRS